MTDEEFREEYQKCLESPAYFYNNYCLIKDKDGGLAKPAPITDEQIKALLDKQCRKLILMNLCGLNSPNTVGNV